MKFPDYVPTRARTYLCDLLEGAPKRLGMRACLAGLQRRRDQVRLELPTSHVIVQDHERRVREYEEAIKRLETLICDPRMKEVHSILAEEEGGAFDVGRFIHTASACVEDYTQHLTRVQEAKDIALEVKDRALELAKALSRAQKQASPMFPEEFGSMDALLERARLDPRDGTYQPPTREVRVYMDRGDGQSIGGPVDEEVIARLMKEYDEYALLQGRELQPEPEGPFDPHCTKDVVLALAAAAKEYTPALTGATYAALASRKKGTGNFSKQQYLRAFIWSLGSINYTPGILKAIALTSPVALGGSDTVVSVAEVKRELKKDIHRPRFAHERTFEEKPEN